MKSGESHSRLKCVERSFTQKRLYNVFAHIASMSYVLFYNDTPQYKVLVIFLLPISALFMIGVILYS